MGKGYIGASPSDRSLAAIERFLKHNKNSDEPTPIHLLPLEEQIAYYEKMKEAKYKFSNQYGNWADWLAGCREALKWPRTHWTDMVVDNRKLLEQLYADRVFPSDVRQIFEEKKII